MNTIHQLEYAIENIEAQIEAYEADCERQQERLDKLRIEADDLQICLENMAMHAASLIVMRDGLQSALDFCREHHPDRPNPNQLTILP